VTKICFDRILPHHLEQRGFGARAISPLGKLWVNGSTLRIRFLDGNSQQQALVRQYAPMWCQVANLKFAFNSDADAEIRIAFNSSDGAWSYIGTDCRSIPVNEPTMNLGWQEEGVILHEFGHAIGLAHEHQNPNGGIQWNEANVIHDLEGPPNNWDEATIRSNVLEHYSSNQIQGTVFDPDSIMLYAFPATWTLNGISTHENTVLSAMDKAFVASAKMYPGAGMPVQPTNTVLQVGSRNDRKEVKAEIKMHGEEDIYSFTAAKTGKYTIETSGNTDVVMRVFGPNSKTALNAIDDDSGVGFNSKISKTLVAGTYYVSIRHYNKANGTGPYGISVIQ
jgi:hypothetical protein